MKDRITHSTHEDELTPSMTVAMCRTMLVEETEAEEVDNETHHTDVEDHLGVVDLFRLVKPLQTLHRDGETEGNQEDGIDQST